MNSLDQRRKQAAAGIDLLSRQVEEMDGKIRAYLADRQNKPHPRHLDLIEKIQGYRVDPSISTKYLLTMLDGLQWKVHYSKRAWEQLWENAEMQRQKDKLNTAVPFTDAGSLETNEDMVHSSAQYSVDTLWEIQKEKIRTHGSTQVTETKLEFKRRMVSEYKKLSQDKKPNQEIIMIFDADSKHCKLDLK